MDEGHVRSHWVGYSEKSPWLLEKKKKKKSKVGMGVKKQVCPPLLCFLLLQQPAGWHGPLRTKFRGGSWDKTAQIVLCGVDSGAVQKKKKIIDTIYNWHLVRRLDFPTVINMPRFAAAPR